MKSRVRLVLLPMAAAAMIAAGGLWGLARAQAPASSASTVPAAATSASAKWPAPDLRVASPLASLTIPTDKSELPKGDKAWLGTTMVEPTRRSHRAQSCRVFVQREYLNVFCPLNTAMIRQFAGPTKDVEVWVTPKPFVNGQFPDLWNGPLGGKVVFPLRKGEGYVFQFFIVAEAYEGFGVAESVVVDASWPESQKTPTLVLR
jgi:hypothetical protein